MRPKTMRATIKEVASVAGVSTQTVSRVINERPDVSPETRKRVQEVIKALSYQPSALARSLISQRSYTLGVVTAGLKHIGPSRTLSGITSAAEAAGYSILLKSSLITILKISRRFFSHFFRATSMALFGLSRKSVKIGHGLTSHPRMWMCPLSISP